MKIKLIALLTLFALGCATTDNKKFNKREVETSFNKAWESYWSKNKNRHWSKGVPYKDLKKVRSDFPFEPVSLRNSGKKRR